MRNLSYENEYDLHSNGLVSKTHFHMKGFALGLGLKQRQKRTRKWPIEVLAKDILPYAGLKEMARAVVYLSESRRGV